MKIASFAIFCLLTSFAAYAQPPTADFSAPAQVCLNEVFTVDDNSTGSRIEWDFCHGDLALAPTAAEVTGVSGSTTLGIDVAFDGSAWYGFVTDAGNNTIIRLSYGADLNAAPTVSSLGSILPPNVSPYDIKVVHDNGQWFGFVYGINELITRLDFGTSLNNTPTSQIIVPGGTGTASGLDVVFSAGKWYVVYTRFYIVTVARLNTITSVPAPADIISTSLANTAYRLGDIKVVFSEGKWFAYAPTFQGGSTLQRFTFGNDLFTVAGVDDITGPAFGSVNPYGIDVGFDNGEYMLFVSTLQGNLVRVNLGSNLLSSPVSQAALGTFSLLNNTLKLQLVKTGSAWQAFTIAYNTGKIFRLSFPSPACGVTMITSADETPAVAFSDEGSHMISLRSFNGNSYAEKHQNLVVQALEAPGIEIVNNGICIGSPSGFSVISDQQLNFFDWDFGDGGTSADDAPQHSYAAPGTYPVRLKVTSVNGCSNRVSDEIKMYNAPVASFNMPGGLLCTNSEVTFTNTTPDNFDGNLIYQWLVDGIAASAGRHLAHNFSNTGAHAVQLNVSIPGCADQSTQSTPALQAGPVVDFSSSGVCDGDNVQFTSNIPEAVTSYDWDFDDGSPSSSAPHPSHLFPAAGVYVVSLTALSTSGCNNTKTKEIIIRSQPSVDFAVDPPPQSCSNQPTPFTNLTADPTDSNIVSWQWDFGDTGAGNFSYAEHPAHTFVNAGNYNVVLTATTDYGCLRSAQKTITIAQSPAATLANTLACSNVAVNFTASGSNIATWYWEMGTSYYEIADPTHTFSTSGDHVVKLKVKNANQCEMVYTKTVSVPAVLSPDFSVVKNCIGVDATFTDITTGSDAVARRAWEFGGLGTATGSSAAFSFSTGGNKTVKLTVTGQSGCSYTASKTVNIVPVPVAGFTASPETGAAPLSVQFTNTSTGATQYLWAFGDGTTSAQVSPAYVFQQTGDFTASLKASNDEGCESTVSNAIRAVTPWPDVDLKIITISENVDGSLKVIITIQNNGNTILRDLPVAVDISGNVSLRETVPGPIAPSSLYNLVLSYGLAPANVHFLCATAELQNDLAPEGNRICTELNDKTSFIAPYPNPAKNILNIEWVARGKQTVSIRLVDTFGKKVLDNSILSVEGLNHFRFDTSQLQSGIYLLVRDDGTTVKTEKVLISAEN